MRIIRELVGSDPFTWVFWMIEEFRTWGERRTGHKAEERAECGWLE